MNKICQDKKNIRARSVYVLLCEDCGGNVGCRYNDIDRYCDICTIRKECFLEKNIKLKKISGGRCSRCLNDKSRVSIFNPRTGLQFFDVWTR